MRDAVRERLFLYVFTKYAYVCAILKKQTNITRKNDLDAEKTLYNGRVTLKFNHKLHRYYVKITDQDGNTLPNIFPSGVTTILKSLYDQTDLLDWYSSMASGDIVKALAPELTKDLDTEFLNIYKDDGKHLALLYAKQITLSWDNLIDLYKTGLEAPHKRSQFGKDVGTQTHEAVDRYHKTGKAYIDLTGVETNDKAAQKSLDMYIKWFEASGLEVTASEVMVYSIDHNYAGTLDRIYKRPDGKLVMGDFKTSNLSRKSPLGIRESYWSQLGAYIVAYREEHGVEFADAVIVNSPKKGTIKIGYASDMGIGTDFLENVWLTDLKAMNNHKTIIKAQKNLKSRAQEK